MGSTAQEAKIGKTVQLRVGRGRRLHGIHEKKPCKYQPLFLRFSR
jgi:hypothetical protein